MEEILLTAATGDIKELSRLLDDEPLLLNHRNEGHNLCSTALMAAALGGQVGLQDHTGVHTHPYTTKHTHVYSVSTCIDVPGSPQ